MCSLAILTKETSNELHSNMNSNLHYNDCYTLIVIQSVALWHGIHAVKLK